MLYREKVRNAMFKLGEISYNSNYVYLKIESEDIYFEDDLVLFERQNNFEFKFPNKLSAKLNGSEKNHHQFSLPLREINSDNLKKSEKVIFDLCVIKDSKLLKVAAGENYQAQSITLTHGYRCYFFKNKSGNVSAVIENMAINKYELINYEVKENKIKLAIHSQLNLMNYDYYLKIKRRLTPSILIEEEVVQIEGIEKSGNILEFEIDFEEFIKIQERNLSRYDLFIEKCQYFSDFYEEKEIAFSLSKTVKIMTKNFYYDFYKNYLGFVTFNFKKTTQKEAYVSNVDDVITFLFKENMESLSCLRIYRQPETTDDLLLFYKEIPIINNRVNIINATKVLFETGTYLFFVKNETGNHQICQKGELPNSFKKDDVNNVIFQLKTNVKPVKISILGACHTRLAFSDKEFYNPGYKNKYEIISTQFHSSVISIMGEAVPYEESYFDNLKERFQKYIDDDFSKNFFNNLDKNKSDYLIIDFFVDACRDLFYFSDNKKNGTINYMNRYNLAYMFSDSLEGIKILNQANFSKYYKIWTEAADRFINELNNRFIPQQIILNRIRRADMYEDTDGKIKKFDKIYELKKSNLMLTVLEDHFIAKLPGLRVIDLSANKYISSYKNSEGISPDHYEEEYYKEFMKELDLITQSNIKKKNMD